ncbi:MAG: hypothetical protein AAB217_00875 [Chloroflexota bacterium]|mgnify:FL=1
MFDEGLRHLLADKTSLEVSTAAYSTDSAFLQQFEEQRPDVVVLFEGGPLSVKQVFDLVGDMPGLTALRVITVMAETSTVEIYEKQQFTAVQSNTLFSLIHQGKSPEDSP